MNGNCHFVYGAAIGTALTLCSEQLALLLPSITASPETSTLFVLGGLLGGIFPDIDNPVSYVGKLTVPVSSLLGTIGKATGKTGKHHRGILHDPIVYITGIILCYLYFTPLLGFFAGCLSHLFLDMFNPSGIPFLFGVKHLHLGKMPSGSTSSVIFTWINVALVIALGVFIKYGLTNFIQI